MISRTFYMADKIVILKSCDHYYSQSESHINTQVLTNVLNMTIKQSVMKYKIKQYGLYFILHYDLSHYINKNYFSVI